MSLGFARASSGHELHLSLGCTKPAVYFADAIKNSDNEIIFLIGQGKSICGDWGQFVGRIRQKGPQLNMCQAILDLSD